LWRVFCVSSTGLHNAECCVLQCLAVSCSVLLCLAVSCCVLLCLAVSCCVLLCLAVSCNELLCLAVSCCVLQCLAVSCSVLLCLAVPCYILQCLIKSVTEVEAVRRLLNFFFNDDKSQNDIWVTYLEKWNTLQSSCIVCVRFECCSTCNWYSKTLFAEQRHFTKYVRHILCILDRASSW